MCKKETLNQSESNVNITVAQRVLTIFYVLDTSGSMAGERIAKLNEAMNETVTILRDIAKNQADAEIKIAVMEFNSHYRWITPEGPKNANDFFWNDLKAGGLTELGEALDELYDKMTREKFMKSATGQYQPIVIFISDGAPTDSWKKSFEHLINTNRWFQVATKIGIAFDTDTKVLSKLVGNSEAVIQTNNLEEFGKIIRFISVTASLVNGRSRLEEDLKSGANIVREAKGDMDKESEPEYFNPTTNPDPDTVGDPGSIWNTAGAGW